MNPTDPSPAAPKERLRLALRIHQQGELGRAKLLYEELLQSDPEQFDALLMLGTIAGQTGDYRAALNFAERALRVEPGSAAAHFHRGLALRSLGRVGDSLTSFDSAIVIRPNYAEAHFQRALALSELGRRDAAIGAYDRAIAIKGDYAEAYSNRGTILMELQNVDAALASFDQAISYRPQLAEAHSNRGNALRMRGRHAESLASCDRAVELDPTLGDGHFNRAAVLLSLGRIEEAAASLERAASLKPGLTAAWGTLLHARLQLCDWRGLSEGIAELTARILSGEPASDPFRLLSLTGSPSIQMTGAVLWAAKRHPPSDPLGPPSSRRAGRRIRVGYFSADFHDHATMHLGLRTLELHDRSQFETMAFSFGPDIRDPMRQRAEAAFDRFVDVRTASDLQIARIAREAQIDIAVDLKGYTEDSRPGIFALRAAPLQVSYLGYPGTMGAATMDYLIADRTIVPDESRLHYREKIIHLPDTYQANDGSRPPVNEPMPRHVAGLPPQGLVFCCFNACYKITPAVFDCWMRILRRVNGSVLWLIADNQTAVANLQVEARRRGVDAARLIFARRMPMRSHLARLCTADLFLDTLPICAHTLASDALWAGLPLLTRAGESFAGRVAASLLLAMGIPELIAYSEREYEDIACKLADNPDRLSNLRQRLAHQRMNGPVFDSARLARTLESAYTAILDRQDKGLTPDHLRVGPLDSALPRPGTTLA